MLTLNSFHLLQSPQAISKLFSFYETKREQNILLHQGRQMKKISMIALSISIALGLSACNPTSKSETTPTAVSASETPMTSGIDLTAVDQNFRPKAECFRHVTGTCITQT